MCGIRLDARVRVERMLKGRAKQHIGLVLEYMFRAIAMVDVKIDDSNPLQLVRLARMLSADSNIVENTKAHRTIPFSVMTGRTYITKCRAALARHDQVDAKHHRTCRA